MQGRVGDEVLQELNIKQICAIKIDVEGAELVVLRGLHQTLVQMRLPVIFEMLPNFSGIQKRVMHSAKKCKKNQTIADPIFKYFSDLGYVIYILNQHTGEEQKIERFELNNMKNFIGSNFIERPHP